MAYSVPFQTTPAGGSAIRPPMGNVARATTEPLADSSAAEIAESSCSQMIRNDFPSVAMAG
jgi:hypothetical protein